MVDNRQLKTAVGNRLAMLSQKTPTEINRLFDVPERITENRPLPAADACKLLQVDLVALLKRRFKIQVNIRITLVLKAQFSQAPYDLSVDIQLSKDTSLRFSYKIKQSLGEWLHAYRHTTVAQAQPAVLSSYQVVALGAVAAVRDVQPKALSAERLNSRLIEDLEAILGDKKLLSRLHAAGFYHDKLPTVLAELRRPAS